MLPHVETTNGVTVVFEGIPYTISNTSTIYPSLMQAIRNHDPLWALQLIGSTKKRVEEAVRLSISLTYSGGCVYHQGKKIGGYAVSKLLGLLDSGKDATPLINFLTKVQANPDPEVIEHLYSFLEKGNMPITPSGDFLAYKAIRENWMDIHSGRFDNQIGSYVQVPRSKVDPNRHQTCSNGLHVCSYSYLPHFSHANGHVVVCQINPADVVAVPNDYDDAKMRVSAYWVIDEVTDFYKNNQNILSENVVWDEEYIVQIRLDDEYNWETIGEFDDYDDAAEAAEASVNEEAPAEVKVCNSEGTIVFYRRT